MTDENLIRQIESTLSDLKSGDETALDRLNTLLGSMVGGDHISVGDISDSTEVGIGHNISMVVNQGCIPDTVMTVLNELQHALKEVNKQSLLDPVGEVTFAEPGRQKERYESFQADTPSSTGQHGPG